MKTLAFIYLVVGYSLLTFSCFSKSKPEATAPKEEIKSSKPTKAKTKKSSTTTYGKKKASPSLNNRASQAYRFIEQKGYSTKYCFLIDMGIHSGKNRFFVYDLENKAIALSGLVAHGTCNTQFLANARFSNSPGSGCSSMGKYKIGNSYYGKYGKSFRLYGLDNSNSNAYSRAVVIHGYECVPNGEIYPRVLCNSLGCPMVSNSFFRKLSNIIERSDKPILLWIYR